MKQPKVNSIKTNARETKKIREAMEKCPSVKITINVDADTLSEVRAIADESGVPYQRLINRLLRESLEKKETTDSRLERLESEVRKLKKKMAA